MIRHVELRTCMAVTSFPSSYIPRLLNEHESIDKRYLAYRPAVLAAWSRSKPAQAVTYQGDGKALPTRPPSALPPRSLRPVATAWSAPPAASGSFSTSSHLHSGHGAAASSV
jgi:hypothetical protein